MPRYTTITNEAKPSDFEKKILNGRSSVNSQSTSLVAVDWFRVLTWVHCSSYSENIKDRSTVVVYCTYKQNQNLTYHSALARATPSVQSCSYKMSCTHAVFYSDHVPLQFDRRSCIRTRQTKTCWTRGPRSNTERVGVAHRGPDGNHCKLNSSCSSCLNSSGMMRGAYHCPTGFLRDLHRSCVFRERFRQLRPWVRSPKNQTLANVIIAIYMDTQTSRLRQNLRTIIFVKFL